ncbi:MAG: hypothetical protein MK082_03380 [Phycisphaerales bacterium]|nr:hypothetical protein [Phycisphaerales bacterium]
MLGKIRSLFGQRHTVEFDVEPDPVLEPEEVLEEEPGVEPGLQVTSLAGLDRPDEQAMELLDTIQGDLARQRDAQERIAEGITGVETQLQPVCQQLNRQMESIASSERHVAELVESFTQAAGTRESALQTTVESLNNAGERQVQVLNVLQQQLDGSQQSIDGLRQQFEQVGSGLEALLETQRATVSRTDDLVEVVRTQIDRNELAQQRVFRVSIALLGLGTIAVLAAVVLVVVYGR